MTGRVTLASNYPQVGSPLAMGEPGLVTKAPPCKPLSRRDSFIWEGADMSPLDENTIEASLARINAGLKSNGSPEVVAQYKQGVYLNQPFGRAEHAHQVAHALGEEQGYTRVERDKGPDQQDQFWVRLLMPNGITDDMLPNATGVMEQMRRLGARYARGGRADCTSVRRRSRPNAHRRGHQQSLSRQQGRI